LGRKPKTLQKKKKKKKKTKKKEDGYYLNAHVDLIKLERQLQFLAFWLTRIGWFFWN